MGGVVTAIAWILVAAIVVGIFVRGAVAISQITRFWRRGDRGSALILSLTLVIMAGLAIVVQPPP